MGSYAEPAADAALDGRPKCLEAFNLTPVPPTETQCIWVDFRLGCKACSGETFQVASFPKLVPDPSPYAGIAPGNTLLRPPHSAKCTACGVRGHVFDPRTDGYDGVLNGGAPYECGDTGEEFSSRAFKVTITLTYNIDLSELQELAVEGGVKPIDLFDWFAINGEPIDGGEPFAEDYECA